MATDRDKRIAAVKRRIVPVRDAEPYVKILVYGRNGKGKTRFAATAPKPLVIDINEKGTRSVRNYKDVDVLPVSKWPDIVYAYWMLREGDHRYESVVIDTLTAMQHLCMRHVLGEEADRDPHKDPNMPSRREWGKLAELMKPLILQFRNLPMHVIFTAQERVTSDSEGGDDDAAAVEHVPDLSPGSRGVAMGAVEVIGRIYQREVRAVHPRTKKEVTKWETRMLVGPHEAYATKDRTGALGRVLREPSVPKIIQAAFQD